jgi:hypothetical protein
VHGPGQTRSRSHGASEPMHEHIQHGGEPRSELTDGTIRASAIGQALMTSRQLTDRRWETPRPKLSRPSTSQPRDWSVPMPPRLQSGKYVANGLTGGEATTRAARWLIHQGNGRRAGEATSPFRACGAQSAFHNQRRTDARSRCCRLSTAKRPDRPHQKDSGHCHE